MLYEHGPYVQVLSADD